MPLRPEKNAVALFAVCLAALMFGLEISSVPVILPSLEKSLHSDFKDVQWIMNAYTLACTTVLMAAGTLADRYGRRRVFLISVVLFGAASLVCGLAPDARTLIASRFLQGVAGGVMLICLLAVLSHQFQDAAQRSKAFATWGIVFGAGLGFGPLIGGAIVALTNWQWVFLVHAPLAALAWTLARGSVQESRDPQAQRLDVAGIVTLSISVFALTFYITQGPDIGFASAAGFAWFGIAAASFVAFLVAERISARPMFDFSVFAIRDFSGAIMGSIGMNFSFWPLMIYLPLYFQGGLGYGVVAAGLALLAYTLPTLVVPPFAERLALRYGARCVIPAGLFTIGLGLIAMKLGSSVAQAGWTTMLPGCVLAGIGLGLTNTPVSNTTTGSVASTRAGMASGIDMSARLITLAINIAMMGFLLTRGIESYLTHALPGAFGAARLHALAENAAAGDLAALVGRFPELQTVEASGHAIRAALANGFGGVMLYGGIGAWLLAAASFAMFRRRVPAHSRCSMAEPVSD